MPMKAKKKAAAKKSAPGAKVVFSLNKKGHAKKKPHFPPGYTTKCHQNADGTCTKHVFNDAGQEVMTYTTTTACPGSCPPI